jgi:hypothetical protein
MGSKPALAKENATAFLIHGKARFPDRIRERFSVAGFEGR